MEVRTSFELGHFSGHEHGFFSRTRSRDHGAIIVKKEGAVMKKIFCSLFVFALIGTVAHASSHEFFKGKTIRLVVGNSTGGAMDDWGRFVAQHLGRHIPGSPEVLVQNMPGAGAIVAANYIYNVAKPDGLTLGAGQSSQLHRSASGGEGSEVRLAEIFLDRLPGTHRSGSVYPHGCSL